VSNIKPPLPQRKESNGQLQRQGRAGRKLSFISNNNNVHLTRMEKANLKLLPLLYKWLSLDYFWYQLKS